MHISQTLTIKRKHCRPAAPHKKKNTQYLILHKESSTTTIKHHLHSATNQERDGTEEEIWRAMKRDRA